LLIRFSTGTVPVVDRHRPTAARRIVRVHPESLPIRVIPAVRGAFADPLQYLNTQTPAIRGVRPTNGRTEAVASLR
jgi:hypothetical protein